MRNRVCDVRVWCGKSDVCYVPTDMCGQVALVQHVENRSYNFSNSEMKHRPTSSMCNVNEAWVLIACMSSMMCRWKQHDICGML